MRSRGFHLVPVRWQSVIRMDCLPDFLINPSNITSMKFIQYLGLASACFAVIPQLLAVEKLTILHVGDQESWLISAQGNLRDNNSQPLSFYGGVDRVATRLAELEAEAVADNRSVLKLNAGDVIIPGPRFNASLDNLATSATDGGQDYYDAIAARAIEFDAFVFGNHEFDFGVATASRFADVTATANSPYLSFNLDFSQNAGLASLEGANKVATHAIFTTSTGKNVAVIGLTTPRLPAIASPETLALMQGFRGFDSAATEAANIAALVPSLQALINDLRNNQDVTVVILLAHMQGLEVERDLLIPALTGVDLVVSGGGHELQTNANSSTIPTTSPVFGPALPNPPISYPVIAKDNGNNDVPIVTASFANRYIGQITLDLDEVTGEVLGIDDINSRVVRVSGRAVDADAVTGDPFIFSNVVQPVVSYVQALEAEVIATTNVFLNGERGTAGVPRNFTPGVRNAATNLGNLVADSLRFSADADVSIQNGGGVRASIPGPNITVGDTFTTLTFLNLVVRDDSVTAGQLKAVLENGFSRTTPSGAADGRFPQLSGVEVVYDSTRSAGDRVRRIVLTGDPSTMLDNVLLVDFGQVVDPVTTFSVATIDFLANGGDGYPFVANGFSFSNLTQSRNYQEALVDYIVADEVDSGLERVVSMAQYPVVDPFVGSGRSADMIYATNMDDVIVGTTGRDFIFAGAGNDVIQSSLGGDIIRTGSGSDTVVYSDISHAGDEIIDFEVGSDKIDVSEVFASASINPSFGRNIRFVGAGGGSTNVQVIIDGQKTTLLTVRGVAPGKLIKSKSVIY